MTLLAGEPLPVEFCHAGAWHPGVLLGWRHQDDGTCRLRVQFLVGGLRRTSWIPMVDVRLPELADIGSAPVPRQWREPGTRPDVLLRPPDGPRGLPSLPPLPHPRSHDDDLTLV